MGRNTSGSLGSHIGELRQLDEENKIIDLRKAIDEGLNSGRAQHFDPQKHLTSLKARMMDLKGKL
jgi:hypothetical protein